MFNDITIVQSAISAFNNYALVGPAFLWLAVLSIPLMVMVYFCGADFLGRFGWNKENMIKRAGIWTAGLAMAWIVMFSGNYAVLRDGVSVLPFMVASIVFLGSLFLGAYSLEIKLNLPRRVWVVGLILWVGLLAMSNTGTWWGPLLQIGACGAGVGLGRKLHGTVRPVAGTVLITLMVVIAMLMQPEFFRFGQLGNLTPAHLLAVLLMGVFAMAVIATYNVKSAGKIHRSAYVKLKWMIRFMVALAMVLFVMTESIPLFVGMMGALFVSFAMSVWHMGALPDALAEKLFAIMLGVFGVIVSVPVITALGVVLWAVQPKTNFWADFRRLL